MQALFIVMGNGRFHPLAIPDDAIEIPPSNVDKVIAALEGGKQNGLNRELRGKLASMTDDERGALLRGLRGLPR